MIMEGIEGSLRRQIGSVLGQIDQVLGESEDKFVDPTNGDRSDFALQTTRQFLRALINSDTTKQRVTVSRRLDFGREPVEFDVSDPGLHRSTGGQ